MPVVFFFLEISNDNLTACFLFICKAFGAIDIKTTSTMQAMRIFNCID